MRLRFAIAIAIAIAVVGARAAASSAAADAPSRHDFGTVVAGPSVEHVFRIPNRGTAPVRVDRVLLTPPLVVARLPASIPAGGDVALPVRLDTTKVDGPFEGEIAVFLRGVDEPIALELVGVVVGPVEVTPRRFVVLGAVRGEAKQASVDLVSHETTPLRVDRVESASPRFTTRVETIDPGRRLRLHVTLRPDAPTGRAHEPIVVHTSSASVPVVHLAALVNVHERVYTFPGAIDLGAIPAGALAGSPGLAERLAQTLMVYQTGGTAFEASFRTNVPGLVVTAARGPKGDRFQATVRLTGTPKPGPLSGTIVVETNDPEFPRLEVPVAGTILD